MKTYSESELITALRQRDADAFAFLFENYSDRIYRLAAGLLGDEMAAEGVVQESFMRLFERLDQFEGRSKISTWLYRVAYNAAIDQLRKRRPIISLDLEIEDEDLPQPVILIDWQHVPERLLTEAEIKTELDRAIAELPEKYRVVFILREIEGLSTKEASAITGMSTNLVKVRLHRARLILREKLAESLIQYA
jgi:RNA polymerase sigma-70 factor (ECF subfamily)